MYLIECGVLPLFRSKGVFDKTLCEKNPNFNRISEFLEAKTKSLIKQAIPILLEDNAKLWDIGELQKKNCFLLRMQNSWST